MLYPIHPLAAVFPPLSGVEFKQLKDSIEQVGQLHRVTLMDGMILDGVHRARACEELGLRLETEDFEPTDMSAVELVLAKNLHRRHMNEGQRAMVVADLVRVKWGRPARKPGNSQDFTLNKAQAARLAQVSVETITRALAVRDAGIEQLKADVRSGKISVSAAAEQVKPPKPKKNFIEAFAHRLDKAMTSQHSVSAGADASALRAEGVAEMLKFISVRIAEHLGDLEFARWEKDLGPVPSKPVTPTDPDELILDLEPDYEQGWLEKYWGDELQAEQRRERIAQAKSVLASWRPRGPGCAFDLDFDLPAEEPVAPAAG